MRSLISLAAVAVLAVALSACSGGGSTTSTPSTADNNQSGPSSSLNASDPSRSQSVVTQSSTPAILLFTRGTNRNVDAATQSNLTYHGGPVMNAPNLYVVFWGWRNDPYGESSYLQNFLRGIGGSNWLNTVTQYGSSAGPIVNATGQLKGVVNDSDPIPSHPTDYQVAVEAYYASIYFKNAGPDAAYIIATPTGHYTRGFGTQWCSYHSYATTSSGTVINYTNLPYMTDAGYACGANSVNSGTAGYLDGVSIVAGHEVAESESDPEPNTGWLDSSGEEIGDKCAWTGLADVAFSSGTFAVQPLWDNARSGCALSGP